MKKGLGVAQLRIPEREREALKIKRIFYFYFYYFYALNSYKEYKKTSIPMVYNSIYCERLSRLSIKGRNGMKYALRPFIDRTIYFCASWALTAASNSSLWGVILDLKRSTKYPSRETRNFSKFQSMGPVFAEFASSVK